MANSNLAYRSSISIGNISKSVSGLRDSISGTQSTVVRMGTALRDSNSYKLSSISKSDTLFRSRREAVRRREQEDIVEASSVGGAVKRTGRIISSSTKGFLGRIFDFVGTLMVGWLVNNLPTIINLSKSLVERIQKYVSIGSDAISGLSEMMSGFGGVLGGIYSNIISFDFTDSEGKVSDSMDKLFGGFRKLEISMFRFINLFTQDFNKVFGFDIPEIDLPDLPAPGDSGAPGGYTPGGIDGPEVSGGRVNPQAVYQHLRSKGISHIHAMGILANIQGESGFQIGVTEKGGSKQGIGLFQYTYPSRKNAFLKAVPDYRTNWKGQVDYAIGVDKNTPIYLAKEFSTPEQAADDWMRNWENPDRGVYAARRKIHNDFIKGFKTPQAGKTGPVKLGTSLSKGQNISGMIATKGVGYAEVTSLYGMRGGKMHKGIDIAAPAGTYIALRVDCRVIATQTGGDYGNVIDVWVPQYNVQLRFAHCQSFIITSGEVKAGTSFARVGSTGRSSGPHIHFEYSTKYNDTNYGGSGDPSAYVGLILLTNGKSQASATIAQTNKPPAAQINIEDNKRDIAALKKEKGANVITVPAPQQPQQVASAPIMMEKESSYIPSGDNVNTFISKKFLLDLAYT